MTALGLGGRVQACALAGAAAVEPGKGWCFEGREPPETGYQRNPKSTKSGSKGKRAGKDSSLASLLGESLDTSQTP